MVTRRTFLQGAITLATAGTPALANMTGQNIVVPEGILALVDMRTPTGSSFARVTRDFGARTLALPIDPYGLWRREVVDAISRPPVVIGLSNLGTLFCLERLGWDLGLRVKSRIEHLPQADGGWRHHAHASPPDWATDLLNRSSADFGPAAARIVLECRDGLGDCTHAAPARHPHELGEPLVTWLLAPRT